VCAQCVSLKWHHLSHPTAALRTVCVHSVYHLSGITYHTRLPHCAQCVCTVCITQVASPVTPDCRTAHSVCAQSVSLKWRHLSHPAAALRTGSVPLVAGRSARPAGEPCYPTPFNWHTLPTPAPHAGCSW